MAIATAEISAHSGAWTLICENAANAYIQLRSDGPVLIHGATADPGVGDTTGAVLHTGEGGLRAMQIMAMEVGDKLYARAIGPEIELLSVITS